VVGFSAVANKSDHAFLYSSGTMQDLNDLITPNSGWTLLDATAINEAGQITGFGSIGGQTHVFLLNATAPEPASLGLLGTALLPIAGLARRRKV
jgi:probable HAF family extracellular repeat protein